MSQKNRRARRLVPAVAAVLLILSVPAAASAQPSTADRRADALAQRRAAAIQSLVRPVLVRPAPDRLVRPIRPVLVRPALPTRPEARPTRPEARPTRPEERPGSEVALRFSCEARRSSSQVGVVCRWQTSEPVAGFRLLRSVDGGEPTLVGRFGGEATAYREPVRPGHRYTYGLTAYDADGNAVTAARSTVSIPHLDPSAERPTDHEGR